MIYDKVKEICNRQGVSVGYVEKTAGLGNGTISKWNDSSPSVDRLVAVANVLNVSLEELVKE